MTNAWFEHPEQMGSEALEQLPQLIAQYPYCATYRLLYAVALANVHSTQLRDELPRAAVALPDRKQLFLLINKGEYDWVELMQQLEERRRQRQDETNDFALIDRFLSGLSAPASDSPLAYDAETATAPYDATDLLSLPDEDGLPADDQAAPDETDALIDNFLKAEEEGTLFVPKAEPADDGKDDPAALEKIKEKALLSESLAKIYVKKHKFEQALAIFLDLNLKYPKKSRYFADQIRYLETIIAYENEAKAETSTAKK